MTHNGTNDTDELIRSTAEGSIMLNTSNRLGCGNHMESYGDHPLVGANANSTELAARAHMVDLVRSWQ